MFTSHHMLHVRHPVSGVRCHVSGVTCQVSGVTCQVSGVTCHMWQSDRASRWRVCYPRGLPLLVYQALPVCLYSDTRISCERSPHNRNVAILVVTERQINPFFCLSECPNVQWWDKRNDHNDQHGPGELFGPSLIAISELAAGLPVLPYIQQCPPICPRQGQSQWQLFPVAGGQTGRANLQPALAQFIEYSQQTGQATLARPHWPDQIGCCFKTCPVFLQRQKQFESVLLICGLADYNYRRQGQEKDQHFRRYF